MVRVLVIVHVLLEGVVPRVQPGPSKGVTAPP